MCGEIFTHLVFWPALQMQEQGNPWQKKEVTVMISLWKIWSPRSRQPSELSGKCLLKDYASENNIIILLHVDSLFLLLLFLDTMDEIILMFSETWDRPYSVCWKYSEGRKFFSNICHVTLWDTPQCFYYKIILCTVPC